MSISLSQVKGIGSTLQGWASLLDSIVSGGIDSTVLAAFPNSANSADGINTLDGTGNLTYPSTSNILASNTQLKDPAGNLLSDGSLYYPSGGVIADGGGTLYYSTGATLADSGGSIYYSTGLTLCDDAGNIYYGDGPRFADQYGNVYAYNGFLIIADDGSLNYTQGYSSLTDSSGNLYYSNVNGVLADSDGDLYSNLTSGQALISGGSGSPITGLAIGAQLTPDTGWTANASAGSKTVAVQNFAASGFNGTMVTALNTVSAGSGTFFAAQAQQVQDLTNKLQAIEAALVALLLPNA